MELFLKMVTTTLLLLVLTLYPVHLENVSETTVPVGRTIDKSWLRLPSLLGWSNTDTETTEESDLGSEWSAFGSADDNGTETTEYPTEPPTSLNETTLAPANQDSNVSTTTQFPNSDPNVTNVDTGNNKTVSESVEEIPQNSTNASNGTEAQTTTSVPGTNGTSATTVDSGEGITDNDAVMTTTTLTSTSTSALPVPEETTQEITTEPKPTASSPPESTTSAPVSPDRTNQSDKGAAASGGTAERGFASESEKRRRKSAWGAVLGTFVAIAVVGLVAYVILKKKHHKAFSHRKLEEDFPSDPVLRLDNSEPLDLNFGRAAYYNPGLQGDNIQMSPFPKN